MNKLISGLLFTTVVYAAMFPTTTTNAQTLPASSKTKSEEIFAITSVPAENGSYTINPRILQDGKVPAGTMLTSSPYNFYHHGNL